MKSILFTWSRIKQGLLSVMFLLLATSLVAQNTQSSNLKDFKIVIEKTSNGLKLQGVEGTIWKDLSFTINKQQPQAINTYGMTTVDTKMKDVDDTYARFLFTVTKTANGIELKGLEGTAWLELSTTLSFNGQKIILDQFGLKNVY